MVTLLRLCSYAILSGTTLILNLTHIPPWTYVPFETVLFPNKDSIVVQYKIF